MYDLHFRVCWLILWMTLPASFSRCSDTEFNISRNKTARQSTNGRPQSISIANMADRAVDGNRNSNLEDGESCAHPTAPDGDTSWWQVDLLKTYVVQCIIIYNRNNQQERIINTTVLVSDSNSTTFPAVPPNACNVIDNSGMLPLDVINMECDPPSSGVGRFLTLKKWFPNESLNFCEVEVYGYKFENCTGGYYGPGCSTNCNCDSLCDVITGACPTYCVPGKMGLDCQRSCSMGHWGYGCMQTCDNCLGGQCRASDGVCIHDGCADEYHVNSRCDWELPSMRISSFQVIPGSLCGCNMMLQLERWSNATMPGNGTVYLYYIEYREANSVAWDYIRIPNQHADDGSYVLFNVSLPQLHQRYDLRVGAFQEAYGNLTGEPTKTITVTTNCKSGTVPLRSFSLARATINSDVKCCYAIPTLAEVKLTISVGDNNMLIVHLVDENDIINLNSDLFLEIQLKDKLDGASHHGWSAPTDHPLSRQTPETSRIPRDVSNQFFAHGDNLYINSLYNARVVTLVNNTYYTGYSLPTGSVTFETGCRVQDMGESCHSLCNCSSGLCLLASHYCHMDCDVASEFQNYGMCSIPLPSIESDITTTSSSETIMFTFNCKSSPDELPIVSYTIIDLQNNAHEVISASGSVTHTMSPLEPNTNYKFWVSSNVDYNSNVFPGKGILIVTSTTPSRGIPTVAVVSLSLLLAGLVIGGAAVLAIFIRKRHKTSALEHQQIIEAMQRNTYKYMNDTTDIDPAVDIAHEELLPSPSDLPDVLDSIVYMSDLPPTPMKRTASFGSMFNIKSIPARAGINRKTNMSAPRLKPRLKRTSLLSLSKDELDARRGSDTKLHYTNVLETSFANDKDEPAELDYDSLEGIPIAADDLGITVANLGTVIGISDGFSQEYHRVPNNTNAPSQVSLLKANKAKNRYIDIRPYDHSRVVLDQIDNDCYSDYINASFIDGYGQKEDEYIAAQAPKVNTVVDMWRMIWQTNANVVVMLTNIVENGRQKSERYWPRQRTERYGDVEITMTAAEGFAYHVKRKFLLRQNRDSRIVTHLQFTGWPDHGVPASCLDILDFYYKVKSLDSQRTGPLILHCSAGIGRTGSFIAIDYLMQQVQSEQMLDVFKCVSHMRINRYQMVQTESQYKFIYEAILDAITYRNTGIPLEQFTESMARILMTSPSIRKLVVDNQQHTYVNLDVIGCDGMRQENKQRNRMSSPVPPDHGRPHLMAHDGGTDYINAVFVDSYARKRAFIATQLPVENTKEDFWRMITEHKCSSIVLLEDDIDNNDSYWPNDTENPLAIGQFIITLTGSKFIIDNNVAERQFKVQDSSVEDSTHIVSQWQMRSWPADNDTSDLKRELLMSLNECVEMWHKDQHCTGPVVVQCLNGVDRCDLYVTLCYVLQKMSSDGVVDVPFAIRQVRSNRPQFMTSLHHVRHICDVVLALNSGDYADYTNEW